MTIEINAVAMRRGSKIAGDLAILRDVTERKRAEEALADEALQRRILVEQSSDGIVVLDQNGNVFEANHRFSQLLGYSPEETLKLHVWDWDTQWTKEQLLEMLRSVGAAGDHFETYHRRKDGTTYDVEISTNGATVAGHKLIFCVCRDITERKRAEEKVRHAAEEWRTTFDSITDAISIHDRDYRILRVNMAFADLFHRKPQQLIGKRCYEVMHGTEEPSPNCPHKRTLETAKPATAEFYEPHLGMYLQQSTSPVFNDKGEIVSTVHIAQDISMRKQQEEQLIMTDRLASIGELVSGIAHELNNPLTSVIGFSQLLKEADISPEAKEDLDVISKEAERAASIVKNLLTFARKHEPVKQRSHINNIIEDVIKLRTYEQKVNNITLRKSLARKLPEIMADYFQVQQVFLNIIVNAEAAMVEAHKKGALTISTRKIDGTIRISFTDNGPGITKENLNRIFNPFFTTKEVGKGTGLGLSICHGIVNAHGGKIYARSKPGSGATFVVELPVNSS